MKRLISAALLCSALLLACIGGVHAAAGEVINGSLPQRVRAFHFVLRAVSLARAQWLVDVASQSGFNVVVVTVTDGVALKGAPWTPLSNAWSEADFKAWADYANRHGLVVVPEIKLLTHQELFFQNNFPGLMFSKDEYNPNNIEAYKKAYAAINELIDLLHPAAIHIGHDELGGALPADWFVAHVINVHDYLQKRGVATWMWGDMLISKDEFRPKAVLNLRPIPPGFGFHDVPSGYGRAARTKLPRDIVICDWHYNYDSPEFPSLAGMGKEGFKVIGATFYRPETVEDFSRYAAKQNAYGMMATTWFYVQQGQWDTVESILRTSGREFARDFPDARQ